MTYVKLRVMVDNGSSAIPVYVTVSEKRNGTVFVVKILYWEYDHDSCNCITEDDVIYYLKKTHYSNVKTEFI